MHTDILSTLKDRLAEAETETQSLRNAIAALEGSKPTKNGTDKPNGRPRRKPIRAVDAETDYKVIPAGKLVSLIAKTDGVTTSTLAKTTGGEQTQILALLKEAETDGKVKRSGARRGTRWHVISDDDRGADRPAEREASQKASKRKAALAKAAANRKLKTEKAKGDAQPAEAA